MIYALYSDGATYRVLYDPSERKTHLATTTGEKMEVPYTVNGASFVRFDFSYVPVKGLRATDIYDNRARFHKAISLLTPPTKPTDYVPPAWSESDTRLHVEQGGDSFRALQSAGAQAEAAYRANRNRERRQMQETLSEPNARKTQEARRVATEIAQQMRPRGKGAAQLIQNDESYQEFKDALNPRPKTKEEKQ